MLDAEGLPVWAAGYRAEALLSDPATCGEDLVGNLDLLARLSEDFCVDCGGYHAWHGIDRVIRTKTGIDDDRPDLIAALQGIIASIAESKGTDAIELLIPGSADTGILATCAHAAWSLGEATGSRLRYTIMDLCETPLSLCRVYAKHHGLAVQTIRTDFTAPLPPLTADIVLLHSILNYIPPARHVGFLRELGTMLNPLARMIVSTRIEYTPTLKRDPRDYGLLIKAAQDSGRLKPSVPVDRIMSKTKGFGTVMHEFASEEEVLALLAEAGLTVKSSAKITRMRERPAGAEPTPTYRFFAAVHR
jgi:hypothetical protein